MVDEGGFAVANQSSNTVSILRNNGDGTFGARVDYEVGSWAWGVAFGDVQVASNKTMYLKIYNDGTDSTLGSEWRQLLLQMSHHHCSSILKLYLNPNLLHQHLSHHLHLYLQK